jgi:hypothetical protein
MTLLPEAGRRRRLSLHRPGSSRTNLAHGLGSRRPGSCQPVVCSTDRTLETAEPGSSVAWGAAARAAAPSCVALLRWSELRRW